MKTVKFVSRDKQQFAAALRKNVNAYFKEKNISTKGGEKLILKAITMLSLYLLPFVAILVFPMSGWLLLVLAAVMGIGMAGTGMSVMHDAAHGSFSGKGWLNKLFSSTMYLIGGNVFNWKIQHNIFHHTFTNIQGYDEDINSRVMIRLSHEAPLRKHHRFQHVYIFFLYSLLTISKLVNEFTQLWQYNKSGLTEQQKANPKKEYTKLVVSKVLYLFIAIGLPMLVTDFAWWQILLAFLVMHLTAGMIMSVIFQLAHIVEGVDQPVPDATGSIETEWTVHELLTTANFARRSKLMSWYIGGLNFQIEHHLFPHISHVHYPKISPIVEKTAQEFGLPYNVKKNFFDALFSHIRMLKELGRHRKPAFIPVKNAA